MDSTTTTTKISFNSIPIHNLSPLHVPEIHIADESIKVESPEMVDYIDTDNQCAMLSAQSQPPSLPGLIRNCPVPPPIPMQWQLTVPSESELEDYNLSTMSSMGMGMDRDREIALSPDDNYHNDIFSESHSSIISFSQLPDMHGLHNSSSNHSNHSNYSNSSHSMSSSMSSLSSLHSLSYNQSCSWINTEYEHNYNTSPLAIDCNNVQTLKLKDIKLIHIDDSNKFETNRDTIYDTLCQFEDGSCWNHVDDDTNNDDDNNTESDKDKFDDKISTKYELKHDLLMNGFIRDLQKEIKQIIPKEINKICSEFYYEKEQKYVHLTYSIHNHHQHILKNKDKSICDHEKDEFRDRPWRQNTFSGKELIEMMDDMDIKCNYNDLYFGSITMEEICDHLIEYGLIECVSYKTHFSALFTNNNGNNNTICSSTINWDKHQFKSSHDYLYNFTQNALSAIKQFNKSTVA